MGIHMANPFYFYVTNINVDGTIDLFDLQVVILDTHDDVCVAFI